MSDSEEELQALSKLMGDPSSADALRRAVDRLARERSAEASRRRDPTRVRQLRALYESYAAGAPEVKPGDLVQWKQGLKNRRLPEYDEPVVVIKVLPETTYSTNEDAGSAYFQEPLTMVLGVMDSDGELVAFHFDGARFMPFAPATIDEV